MEDWGQNSNMYGIIHMKLKCNVNVYNNKFLFNVVTNLGKRF